MSLRRVLVRVACWLVLATAAHAQYYIWTGIGTGWQQQLTPPNDGTADLYFGDNVKNTITFGGNYWAKSLNFITDDGFRFVTGGTPLTLRLDNGITTNTGLSGVRLDLAQDIVLNLPGAQTWDLGDFGTTTIHGQVTGSGTLTVTGTNQALILNNLSGNATTFSGDLVFTSLASSSVGSFPTLVLWGPGSLGTGSITFTNGGSLVTHQAPTITNALVLNTGPLLSGQVAYSAIRFRNWDGPATTIAGPVTLANNTTIQTITGYANKIDSQNPNNTGSRPLPGPLSRYPVIFTGAIGETGGNRTLNVIGPGITIFAGTNTYTGGTNVGFFPLATTGVNSNGNGSLIFATQAAIPTTNVYSPYLIQVGLANNASATGYVGIATSAVPGAGDFNTFLNQIAPTSSGSVGVDTLDFGTWNPSATPATFSDTIDLTHFTTTASNGIRLGTATSAVLTGAITPQVSTVYHFGNGGGKLYVQTNLANQPSVTTSVQTTNNGVALLLYLQGNNTYTGGTFANNGFIIFDGANSVPLTGSLRAGGASTNVGVGYVGFTDNTLGGTSVSGATLTSGVFSKFDKTNTWGVLGLDSTINGTLTVNNLDLTGFNDGVFIGTTSAAVLTGTLTGTTVGNINNTANTLRFTAATGGTLTVNSTIGGSTGVIIGTPGGFQKMSDGTVILGGTNTYTGGTTINGFGGITLAATNNSSFGTGAISLAAINGFIGLSATNPGLTIANPINFIQDFTGNGFTPQLMLTGANDFTLSGSISGPPKSNENYTGSGSIYLTNPTPINVTLSGNNDGFAGLIQVSNGTLTFASDTAAGMAQLVLDNSAGTLAFTSAAPTVYGLQGDDGGSVTLGSGTNLTIDASDSSYEYSFNGVISGAGALTVNSTSSADSDHVVYLAGANTYTGGTLVTNHAILALGHDSSAGSGPVTLSASDGGILLNSGVTFTNALQFNSGGLGGLGTFTPSSINGTPGAPFVFGTGQFVVPGLPGGDNPLVTGNLTLGRDTYFQDGGEYEWHLQDITRTDGFSRLDINGNLDLLSLSTGGFTLELFSFDANGNNGWTTMNWGDTYSYTILTTTGTINGFNAANFTIDTTYFQGGLIPNSAFALSVSGGNSLVLTFQTVPEPSTWALLATGAAGLGLRAWRRRRAA